MYCPYCKNKLENINGELTCIIGDCVFSKSLSQEMIKASENITDQNFFDEKWENKVGRFWCIRCGNKMYKKDEIAEICFFCGYAMERSTIYKTIELNPHN